ncbi:MAG: aspartate kinase [Bacteroidota bacterium]
MQVYKFGGASIESPERMKALLPIIAEANDQLIVVVSAKGKTTNLLETIVHEACNGSKQKATEILKTLEEDHLDYASKVLNETAFEKIKSELNEYFSELQWAVDDATAARFDYSYDQIVCMGEILSTKIFCSYLQHEGLNYEWLDSRDIIRTDDTFRDAKVDWEISKNQAKQIAGKLLAEGKNIVVQGFIGATSDNASVTLGREGSDYSAAMMAAMLGGSAVTIWKDVEGLKNADPKIFNDTVKIEAITYHEVIEMAYYGAQVIHPKTIKPLQNNNIPLYVKCFLNKDLKGTVIQNEVSSIFYPPLIILKKNQILLQVTTRDFSFITEDNLSNLYSIFHNLKIKINLIQNAAISFVACIDNNEAQVKQLIALLEKDFKVFSNEDVSLLTIRHYTPETLFDITKGRYTLLEQKTRETVQVVVK